jgi:fido (protein-threonine AMPylation protein)
MAAKKRQRIKQNHDKKSTKPPIRNPSPENATPSPPVTSTSITSITSIMSILIPASIICFIVCNNIDILSTNFEVILYVIWKNTPKSDPFKYTNFLPLGLSYIVLFKYMHTKPTIYRSPDYVDLYTKIFKDVYRIERETNDLLDQDLYLEYEKFYVLSTPTPPHEYYETYLTIAKLIHLHEIAMKQTENRDVVGKIRTKVSAYNNLHPIIYAPPEHVEVLLNSFCSWFNKWWKWIVKMPPKKRKEFALSLIPRLVMIHPFMDGNKRTSRLLTNVVLNHMNLTTFEWEFSDIELRTVYQRYFSQLLMGGDLSACIMLHQRMENYDAFKESFKDRMYYTDISMELFGQGG